MFGDNLDRIVKGIEKNYEADEIFFTKPGRQFPSRSAVKGVLKDLRRVLFPGYFGDEMLTPSTSPRVLHRRDAHPDRAVAARADRPRAGLHVRRPRRRGGRPGPVAVRRHARAHLRARLRGVHGVLRRAAQHPAGAAHRRAGALRRRPGGRLEGGGHLLVPGPLCHLRVPHRARALPAGRAHHPAHHDGARAQRHGHRHRRGRPDRRVLLHRSRHGRGDRRDHGHRRPREALPGRHAGRAVHARRAAARRGAAPSHHRGRRDRSTPTPRCSAARR